MKKCGNFTQDRPFRTVISIMLQSSRFIEITLRHRCSPMNLLHVFRIHFSNLLHIFRIPSSKNTYRRLLRQWRKLFTNPSKQPRGNNYETFRWVLPECRFRGELWGKLNPSSRNVQIMDKPGSWFLLSKSLKNTCGRVTF